VVQKSYEVVPLRDILSVIAGKILQLCDSIVMAKIEARDKQ